MDGKQTSIKISAKKRETYLWRSKMSENIIFAFFCLRNFINISILSRNILLLCVQKWVEVRIRKYKKILLSSKFVPIFFRWKKLVFGKIIVTIFLCSIYNTKTRAKAKLKEITKIMVIHMELLCFSFLPIIVHLLSVHEY